MAGATKRWVWVIGLLVAAATTPVGAVPMTVQGDRDVDPFSYVSPRAVMMIPGSRETDGSADQAVDEVEDLDILVTLHHVARMQIGQGRLAQRRASSTRIKAYARKLVRDHQTADKAIAALIRRHVPSALPVVQPRGEAAERGLIEESLLAAMGPSFDEEFLRVMVDQHGRTAHLLSIARRVASPDRALQSLIGRMQSTIERHRINVERLLRKTLNAGG